MAATRTARQVTFRVLDAMNAPHGGRILRLRLQSGEPPSVKDLKGARMRASAPDGERSVPLKIKGFAVFGGKPSDERLARTGRIDVHVEEEGEDGPVSLQWTARLGD